MLQTQEKQRTDLASTLGSNGRALLKIHTVHEVGKGNWKDVGKLEEGVA
jgi:hypothetical protein